MGVWSSISLASPFLCRLNQKSAGPVAGNVTFVTTARGLYHWKSVEGFVSSWSDRRDVTKGRVYSCTGGLSSSSLSFGLASLLHPAPTRRQVIPSGPLYAAEIRWPLWDSYCYCHLCPPILSPSTVAKDFYHSSTLNPEISFRRKLWTHSYPS